MPGWRADEDIPYILRARGRYYAAHAIAHCVGAVYRVLEVNGGRTMNAGGAFQRLFRDLLAMRNHIGGTLDVNASPTRWPNSVHPSRPSTPHSASPFDASGTARMRPR